MWEGLSVPETLTPKQLGPGWTCSQSKSFPSTPETLPEGLGVSSAAVLGTLGHSEKSPQRLGPTVTDVQTRSRQAMPQKTPLWISDARPPAGPVARPWAHKGRGSDFPQSPVAPRLAALCLEGVLEAHTRTRVCSSTRIVVIAFCSSQASQLLGAAISGAPSPP